MGNPEDAFPQSVHTVPNSERENYKIEPTHINKSSEGTANNSNYYDDQKDKIVLDLSSSLVSEFPGNHLGSNCTHIVHLNIDYNDICEIPNGLSSQLPNLQIFQADGNELLKLPDDFGDFQFLRKLCICENRLKSLPESLMNLKNLQLLKVSSNSLRQLHSEIGQNFLLEELHVEENKLKRLPATLGLLKHLHTLIASDNRIEQLIATIGECENLKVLDLSRNRINQIPQSFGHLSKLTRIDLSENKVCDLGEQFASCSSLESIFLDLNMFAKFPQWFQDLEKVQEISMKSNDLGGAAVPEGFGFKSQDLRILDLRGNIIEVLPKSFCHLSSLKVLMLGTPLEYLERSPNFQNGNWLRFLPDNFHLLTSLTKLCVEENQLLALPERIGDLVNLEEFYFGSNMIDEIPASFTKLPSLKICQLSKNRLKRLPDDFGALTTLSELYLDSNVLRTLPSSMSRLVNMEIFDLTENKLRDVPWGILAGMRKLKALNMFFNKFEVPYSEIPYIIKKTHYAERNPELKNNWRGRNNASMTVVLGTQEENTPTPDKSNGSVVPTEKNGNTHHSEDDSDEEPHDGEASSSGEEDWDTHVVASSSESSELVNYLHPRGDSDDEEDWDKEANGSVNRNLSSDKEEGQFADLDEDGSPVVTRHILPSPVCFDSYGNSSRPIDFAVQYHRQTPYIHHAPSINRCVYSPGPSAEGQFDSDMEEEKEETETIHHKVS